MTAPPSVRFELFAEDVAALCDFLERTLGFTVTGREADYSELTLGTVRIGLGSVARLPAAHPLRPRSDGERKGLGVEIVIETDHVDAMYERAVESGAAMASPPVSRPWGLRDFRIVAPEGYYFRITSRG